MDILDSNAKPLNFWDVVLARAPDAGGYMSLKDGVSDETVVYPLSSSTGVPQNVLDCCFSICPQHQYAARAAALNHATTLSSLNQACDNGGTEESERAKMMEEARSDAEDGHTRLIRAEEEEKLHNATVDQRYASRPVRFGDIIQLRASDGRFLSVRRTMAQVERAHLRISVVEDGDEGSWLQILPAYKYRRRGDAVVSGDMAVLIAVHYGNQAVHVSDQALPYLANPNSGDRALFAREVNAAVNPTRFKLSLFSRADSSQTRSPGSRQLGNTPVSVAQPLCLWHRELEAFLVCNTGSPFNPRDVSIKFERPDSTVVLPPEGLQTCINSNAIWMLEPDLVEDFNNGEASSKYKWRIRHMASGDYLLCDNPSEFDGEAAGQLTVRALGMNTHFLWKLVLNPECQDIEENSAVSVMWEEAMYLQSAASEEWLVGTARNEGKWHYAELQVTHSLSLWHHAELQVTRSLSLRRHAELQVTRSLSLWHHAEL
ncbi:hypothetical protein CYMTET_20639 [Cymbomonas tetramitiformis]|uniref:Inositol 1,4,5-trisphosphate/ryanodine receptor domain-containing protein n=1 Tax=Cymbomonas tetramitiformis TaxID=36881 RepID=A0AAE0G3M7_9CHLO|nr:hypothetical protein CYMTET_20639 [Cymbomonas tetramitiformis]